MQNWQARVTKDEHVVMSVSAVKDVQKVQSNVTNAVHPVRVRVVRAAFVLQFKVAREPNPLTSRVPVRPAFEQLTVTKLVNPVRSRLMVR